jgi:K+-sensing histidine kinase KdpD
MNLFLPHLQLRTYGIAILSVLVALLIMVLLDPVASMTMTPFLLFFGAVVVAAWWGGVGSGLLTTVLATFLSGYFFVLPQHTFELGVAVLIRLGLFIVQGVVVSLICGSLRTTQQRLERSALKLRESEASLGHTNEWVTAILESITEGFYALDSQWRFV